MRIKPWMKPVIGAAAIVLAIAAGSWLKARDALAADVTVYTTPTCGCCTKWAEYVRANGFSVKTVFRDNLTPIKRKYDVSPMLETCHTAIVDGYVVEGHVPIDVIRKLLEERPDAKGIAVPGMPVGSPGMEQGTVRDRYNVVLFDGMGGMTVYARR
jgi:hypothetical protein